MAQSLNHEHKARAFKIERTQVQYVWPHLSQWLEQLLEELKIRGSAKDGAEQTAVIVVDARQYPAA
ncbi:MAG: hypothetical protein ACRCZ5_11385 [Burkholderiales bacterium]